ncbi:hypothetical protein GALL_465180 [mine drainage metagenome]|uniref:Uncharacterized protein n=1 Tax=mine drainage metagenome TaxID=410659 RepID=A0A1J5PVQ5_9ZZZZ
MVQRHRVIAEFYSGFRKDTVRRLLYPDQVFLGQDVIGRDIAQDIGPTKPLAAMAAFFLARGATASGAARARLFGCGVHLAPPCPVQVKTSAETPPKPREIPTTRAICDTPQVMTLGRSRPICSLIPASAWAARITGPSASCGSRSCLVASGS